jgi:hypothetical protein
MFEDFFIIKTGIKDSIILIISYYARVGCSKHNIWRVKLIIWLGTQGRLFY